MLTLQLYIVIIYLKVRCVNFLEIGIPNKFSSKVSDKEKGDIIMGVLIEKVDDLQEVENIVENIVESYTRNLAQESKIIIKPNICAPFSPESGVTTHHEIIKGALNALSRFKNVYIVESDTTSSDFKDNIKVWNPSFLSDYPNTSLVNLSEEKTSTRKITGLEKEYNIDFADLLKNFDYLINIPVLKAHIYAKISVGMKNLFGLLSVKNKSQYHLYIHDLLVALLKEFRPSLTIVDGIQALEGQGPIFGNPVGAGIFMTGDNVVEVDYIASKFIGVDPFSVKYLKNAIETQMGHSIHNIEVSGNYPTVKNFKTYPTLIYQISYILLKHPKSDVNSILRLMDVPEQTKRNTPKLLQGLCEIGMISFDKNTDGYEISKKEDFIKLFPETKHIFKN